MTLHKIILKIEQVDPSVDKQLLKQITLWKTYGVQIIYGQIPKYNDWDSCLLISDDPEFCRYYFEKGMAVIGILNARDFGGDFGKIKYLVTHLEEIEYPYLFRIWQRYQNLPWEICETKRCLIRESTVEDIPDFYQIYNDKEVRAYLRDLYQDSEKEKAYIKDYIEHVYGFYGFGIWTICEKESGRVIGRAGIFIREGSEIAELGYMIADKYRRKGYAEEVCREIIKYGYEQLGFHEFQALIQSHNTASLALVKKLGFRIENEVVVEKEVFQRYLLKYKMSKKE